MYKITISGEFVVLNKEIKITENSIVYCDTN